MTDFDKLISAFGSAREAANQLSQALVIFSYLDEHYKITDQIKILKSKQFWIGLTYLERRRLDELYDDLFVNNVLTITIKC